MDIEELFKQQLENDTEEVSPELWQRLEARMDASSAANAHSSANSANSVAKVGKGISTLGKSLIGIASAAGLFAGGYLILSYDQTPQQLAQTPAETTTILMQEEPTAFCDNHTLLTEEQSSKATPLSADTLIAQASDEPAQATITEPVVQVPAAAQALAAPESKPAQSEAKKSEEKPKVEQPAQTAEITKAAAKPIEALPAIKIRIPNVITPNNDGVNDFFAIHNLEDYPDNELIIFDRNNKVIFNVRGYQNDWDAQGIPQGVYFYNLAIKQGSNCKIFKGSINVIR